MLIDSTETKKPFYSRHLNNLVSLAGKSEDGTRSACFWVDSHWLAKAEISENTLKTNNEGVTI